MAKFAVGIDLGGTNIKAALVKQDEGLVRELSSPTEAEKGPAHVLDRMTALVRNLAANTPDDDIAGIGVGAPGSVNWERTTITAPPNLNDWDVVNVSKSLQERLGREVPVIVENDANVAGLGSAHYGAGKAHDCFIMVTLGTGVGGAIIYRNRIFRGATGGAGEIGHMTIDYEGPYARSGVAGAIEAYLGQRFLSRHARYRLLNRKNSVIHEMAGEDLLNLTPKMLHDAALQDDEAAIEILGWAGHKLGCVLGAAVNLLDIRKIVVGGGVSAAGDYIFSTARATLPQYVTPGLHDGLEIIHETRGNTVGVLGAAHVIFQYLEDPTHE